ncbi:unnamed protein product [Rotaria sordida]|uniref:Beta-galactosidase n=1 Tax=Rotaria sordida TaxID=392033 RepID=A0A818WXB3_9BILA|nr:unnamed protein product [Rotaria sordida]CAF3729537.1 unnamed protein product [Rotaria sordida]
MFSGIVQCSSSTRVSASYLPYLQFRDRPYNVTGSMRSLHLNDVPILVQSGSIHYARIHPNDWLSMIQLIKLTGINCISLYIFWSYHEIEPGVYDWTSERRNITQFIELAKSEGLLVLLRIGPYVDAEWSYGGLPVWLRQFTEKYKDIEVRTVNQLWQMEMQTFTTAVIKHLSPLFASNGGPIFMLQIENEYGNIAHAFPPGDATAYMQWASDMAHSVCSVCYWITCSYEDMDVKTNNANNDYYSGDWLRNVHWPKHNNTQPGITTENWIGSPGWTQFGSAKPHRPIQDFTYSVVQYVAYGAAMHNTYLMYGGTNYGRIVGRTHTTTYSFDPPILEIGIPNNNHFNHLRHLLNTINYYVPALLNVGDNLPPLVNITTKGVVSVIYASPSNTSAQSVIFLINNNDKLDQTVKLEDSIYTVSAWSALIIDGHSKAVVYNSANLSDNTPFKLATAQFKNFSSIEYIPEPSLNSLVFKNSNKYELKKSSFHASLPVTNTTVMQEHYSTTLDKSDYLTYTTSVQLTEFDIELQNITSTLPMRCESLFIFLNRKWQTSIFNQQKEINVSVILNITDLNLKTYDTIELKLVGATMGLDSYGVHFETLGRGLAFQPNDTVMFNGKNIISNKWNYQIGLIGEDKQYFNPNNNTNLPWKPISNQLSTKLSNFNWHRLKFQTPANLVSNSSNLYQVNMTGMYKGLLYMNGYSLGRYLTINAPNKDPVPPCDYRGSYDPSKCRYDWGKPTQILYHFSAHLLNKNGIDNELIIFEETDAVPTQIYIQITALESSY